MSENGKPGSAGETAAHETSASILQQAIMRRLPQRMRARAEYHVPPVPALLEHYVQLFNTAWTGIGRPFTPDDLEQFRIALKRNLEQAWNTSQYSPVVVSFETDPPPQSALSWRIDVDVVSMSDEYDRWVATRTPPLFGTHPDAKILELARAQGTPADVPILDIGAGTGRNTLPLARAGFPTDAVELAASLAAILREEAAKEALPVKVFEGDVLDPNLGITHGYYKILLLAEVVASHFRTLGEVRAVFEVPAKLLMKDGLLVFSVFLTSDGYEPDDLARQMGQVFWCNMFNRQEMDEAQAGQFELVSDESVQAYEKENLPAEAWPPTGWFQTWTGGQDLFDLPVGKPPVELRWLVYRKT